MNVEIGVEAAQFPEKEYIYKRNCRCSDYRATRDAYSPDLNWRKLYILL